MRERTINNVLGIVVLITLGVVISVKGLWFGRFYSNLGARVFGVSLYWVLAGCCIVVIARHLGNRDRDRSSDDG